MFLLLERLKKSWIDPRVQIKSFHFIGTQSETDDPNGLRCWHRLRLDVGRMGDFKGQFLVQHPNRVGIYTNQNNPPKKPAGTKASVWGQLQSASPIEAPLLAGLAELNIIKQDEFGCDLLMECLLFEPADGPAEAAASPQDLYVFEFILVLVDSRPLARKHYYSLKLSWPYTGGEVCPIKMDVEVTSVKRSYLPPQLSSQA